MLQIDRLSPFILAFCGLVLLAPSLAFADKSLDQQRKDFIAAERAWEMGDKTSFQALTKKLHDYPLYPYLAHLELSAKIATLSNAEVEKFLEKFPDFTLASRLRNAWLDKLASQEKWPEFLNFYQPSKDAQLQCQYRTALMNTGKRGEALKDIESLWLTGRSQPTACNAVFSLWQDSGQLTETLVWRRLALAMKVGDMESAKQINRYLPKEHQAWVNTWAEAYKNPSVILTNDKTDYSAHPIGSEILTQALVKLSRQNPEKGTTAWEAISERYRFSREQQISIRRALGLAFAVEYDVNAQTWLAGLQTQEEDLKVREWRIRVALREQDWQTVLAWLDWLSVEEQQSPRWQYWRARALEELGFKDEAQSWFAKAAVMRDYYGFLAADKLQRSYAMQNRPLSFTTEELHATATIQGMQRAHELFFFGRITEARREWEFFSARMSQQQLMQAAKLTSTWGWHSQAINAAFKGNYMDDVELRFPLAHREAIIAQAKQQALEPAWVYGVVRQESAFVADARSPVGALGLMQLMPDTGKHIARLMKTSLSGTNQLLDEGLNIKLGTGYLRNMRNQLGDHAILATAAYNAGRNKVVKWLPDQEMAADIWVETIPYEETRDYVQRVMAYTVVYQKRLGGTQLLNSYMKPISSSLNAKVIAKIAMSDDGDEIGAKAN